MENKMSNIEKLKIREKSVWETMCNGQEVEKKDVGHLNVFFGKMSDTLPFL